MLDTGVRMEFLCALFAAYVADWQPVNTCYALSCAPIWSVVSSRISRLHDKTQSLATIKICISHMKISCNSLENLKHVIHWFWSIWTNLHFTADIVNGCKRTNTQVLKWWRCIHFVCSMLKLKASYFQGNLIALMIKMHQSSGAMCLSWHCFVLVIPLQCNDKSFSNFFSITVRKSW